MKYNLATKTVTSSGEISSKKITLSANAKAFRLIFGQIYPDIMKAIVRELFTNAWDSQKVAGTLDTPIEIHLPTVWEPYFGIRDFGTGMLPNVVDDIYSRIFESTKDASDDEAGMFGMGSKTPLGYADSFSVITYVDGTFWYYDIYMDETGSPIISLKATGKTDEPNGVDVQVAVLESDFDTFREHAEHFALGANTPININREKFLQKREVVKEGNGWQLYNDGKKTQIRMGCVLYTLNTDYIDSYHESYDVRDHFNKPFVLDFNIGDFEVTGSREDIIYNRESVNKITSKMQEAVDFMTEEAARDIQNSNSFYEAFQKNAKYVKIGFAPKQPQYGALKGLISRKNYYGSHIPQSKFKFGLMFNPIKKLRMAKFEPTGLDLSKLYGENVKMNYFIIRQKDELVKKVSSRFENFMNNIERSGLRYSRSNYYSPRIFNMYYIEYDKISELKRLHIFLPKNAVIIELKDIEPVQKVRVTLPKEKFHTKFLIERYSSFEISYLEEEMKNGAYYVDAEYGKLVSSTYEIRKAMKFLNIDFTSTKILVIGKSQKYLVPKMKLINLLGEYKTKAANHTYNHHTMLKMAFDEMKYGEYRDFHENEKFMAKKFPQFVMDVSQVEVDYDDNINETVVNEIANLVATIEKEFEDYYNSNPIFKFVEKRKLAENFEEIENVIEEIKK